MKQLLLLVCVSLASVTALTAQCVPSDTVTAEFGVFPQPAAEGSDTIIPAVPACIDNPYDFTFTVIVPSSFDTGFGTISIDSARIESDGVSGLPAGLFFECNPPSCTYLPEQLSCIQLSGTPDDTNTPGLYPLQITVFMYSPSFPQPIEVNFPSNDGDLIEIEGQYTIELRTDANCSVSTNDLPAEVAEVSQNAPNPFSGVTTITATLRSPGQYSFDVYDLTGKQVHSKALSLHAGSNEIRFDASHLQRGVYFYTLSDAHGKITRRMLVE